MPVRGARGLRAYAELISSLAAAAIPAAALTASNSALARRSLCWMRSRTAPAFSPAWPTVTCSSSSASATIALKSAASFSLARSVSLFDSFLFALAYLNSHFETGIKSPLDAAILERPAPLIKSWSKVDEVPFDFERRRVSVLLDDGNVRVLIVKGAPEELLRLCSHSYSAASRRFSIRRNRARSRRFPSSPRSVPGAGLETRVLEVRCAAPETRLTWIKVRGRSRSILASVGGPDQPDGHGRLTIRSRCGQQAEYD